MAAAAGKILSSERGRANALVPRVVSLVVLVAVLVLLGVLFFQVVAQFIVPLFLAGVLVVVFEPLHKWVSTKLQNKRYTSAAVTTTIILITVLAPTIWLGVQAYLEGLSLARGLVGDPENGSLAESFGRSIDQAKAWYEANTGAPLDMASLTKELTRYAGAAGVSVVGAVIGVVIGIVVTTASVFFFLADGPAMIETLTQLSPMDDDYEHELLERFAEVSRAVVVAMLLSAVVQGLLAGVGYYFAMDAGAPVLLLTAATIVLGLVPFVGAVAVWAPVCVWIFLFQTDEGPNGEVVRHWGATIGMTIYGAGVVSTIDNFIKPYILHGNARLHPLLALLSVLGGVSVLGPVGLLVGPMLVAFLQTLLGMLRRELDRFKEEHDARQAEMEAEQATAPSTPDAGAAAPASTP